MRILITGGTGQLGSDCAQVFSRQHQVLAPGVEQLDITSASDVEGAVRTFRPDVIVNCAAYTRVDACETEREVARQVNVTGPENLAASAHRHGTVLVHVSTDYVFDGRKAVPEAYTETDTPGPISYYGKTKLEGEVAVRRMCADHVIVRTAWLYGGSGPNILKTFLCRALGDPSGEIKVVNDQYGSPTWSYRLALQIARLIQAGGHGVYHATSQGYCTWYDLACYFFNLMDVPHRVVPCSTAQYPTPACRPKNSILENGRLKAGGIDLMPLWEEDLNAFVLRYKTALIEEAQAQEAS